MYATTVLAGLTLLTGAAAELAILYPHAGTTWFTNDTVALNWTSTQPDIDPTQFRVLLSGGGMATSQELANQVPTANMQYRILLPQLQDSDGYIVTFTNTTNTTQVFATSEAFRIEAGTLPTSSRSSSATPSATSSKNLPPNVSNTPASSSVNPFASTSATAASAAGKVAAPVVAAGAFAAAVIAAL